VSRLGFGGYRIDARSAIHRAALERALDLGCNLIDTASSYSDGRSEELVGDVLATTDRSAFVVTKVGYVSPETSKQLAQSGIDVSTLRCLEGGTPYSLEPPVLRATLAISRTRLRRPVLDAVLLHNPERLYELGCSHGQVLEKIHGALNVLNDEVDAGRLRYFGVSSNQLAHAQPGSPLDLTQLMPPSAGIESPLAFIEFPLNLIEREASSQGERAPLVSRAPAHMKTIANRPLNALVPDGTIRLALPQHTITGSSDDWEICTELVSARLRALGKETAWSKFRPMQFLRDSREDIAEPELVDVIWANQIFPFVAALYDGKAPRSARLAFERLRVHARACAQAHQATRTRRALAHLRQEGVVDADLHTPLALRACRFCLSAGCDHVLVGMRRPEYVDQLRPLMEDSFAAAASSRTTRACRS
jgi:aryl-alcohol dehydrogenase-like predicted oxidoreductase